MKPTPASPRNIALATLLGLALVLLLGGPARADRSLAQAHLQRAVTLAQKGKIAEADLEFQKAVTADPKWDKAHALRAGFYMGGNNFTNAEASWRKAVALAPKNATYRERLATCLMEEKKWDQAAEAWSAVRKLRPQDAMAPYNLARISFEKNDLDKAESFLGQAQKIESSNSKFILLQARIDIKRENYDIAAGRLRPLVPTIPEGHPLHEEAQALLDEVEGVLRGKKIQVGLMIGVPILLIAVAFAAFRFMRRVDIKAPPTRLDPSSADTICRYVMDHVAAITGLPRGLCWSVGLDGQRMDLQASELMGEAGPLEKRGLDREGLERWIEAHGGGPFLYKVEVKEPLFLQAFPGLVADLGSVEMNVGVPLMWKGSFRGLLLLGRSRSAGKMDLRNRFEKNAVRIQEVAEQGAQALDQLHKEHMQVVDVETGVWNREYYDRALAEALQGCRTAGLPLALFMVRMDAFDEIHERYGEKMSGEILTSLVQVLQEALRQEVNTTLCRLEGGVFGVVAPERGLREAPSLAQKLKAAIDGLKISRNLPKPTGCVAYGVFPDHADEANTLRRTTSRAFRDAVYLEGNRILEAERGGAMDKDDEIEPGRKAAGRRALTGEVEAAPAPAPEPTGPKPFMPFTTARPKAEPAAEASRKEEDAEEEVTAPVRSRFAAPAGPAPAVPAPAAPAPAPASAAPTPPARPAAPAPPPAEAASAGQAPDAAGVPQAETPRSTPASLGRIGRLGLGAAAGAAGEKSTETRILPRPSSPATSSEGPAAAGRKPLPRFGASGRSLPAPTPQTPPEAPKEEVPAPPPRPTPRLAAPAGKGAPPPPDTEAAADPVRKPLPVSEKDAQPAASAEAAPPAPAARPGAAKPELLSSGSRPAVPSRPTVPPTSTPPPAAEAAPASAATRPTTLPAPGKPAAPATPAAKPATPAAPAAKPATPATPAAKPAAPATPAAKPASPPTLVGKPAAPAARPTSPMAAPAARAGAATPSAPAAPPAPAGTDEPGIDPDTQFAVQETFEDLAAFEVRSAGEAGEPCSILYLRLANLEELKSAGPEEYRRARRDVTSLVHAFVRDGVDLPGLVGPDDFALLLTGTGLSTASGLANQIAMTVNNLQVGGHKVIPAVGVASFPNDPVDGSQLIQHAREAAGSGEGVHVYGSGS